MTDLQNIKLTGTAFWTNISDPCFYDVGKVYNLPASQGNQRKT